MYLPVVLLFTGRMHYFVIFIATQNTAGIIMQDATEQKLEHNIKREFQLERMVLFSDAVFAIVITLMAIEIKIPESETRLAQEEFWHHIKMLIPTILAYVVSFFFIGITWYRHLQIFARLKDYDKGLVICNLAMLFCIGLFPFAASLISHPNNILGPYLIYFIIAFLSAASQNALQYYIYYKHTFLLSSPPTKKEKDKLKVSIILLVMLAIAIIIAVILFNNIEPAEYKPFAMVTLFIVPIGKRVMERKMKVND